MAEIRKLTTKEGEVLNQFRQLLAPDVDEKILKDDIFLLRFLIARDFDIEKAEKMLKTCLEWRHDNKIDGLREEEVFPQHYEKVYPWSLTGEDKCGRPVFYVGFGKWDSKKACLNGEKETLGRWVGRGLETAVWACEGAKWKSEDPSIQNKGHSQFILVNDLEGFSYNQFFNKNVIDLCVDILRQLDAYYPETLFKLYLINAPSIFTLFWNIIRPLIPARTVEKVDINGTNKDAWRKKLDEVMDLEQLDAVLRENSSRSCAGQPDNL